MIKCLFLILLMYGVHNTVICQDRHETDPKKLLTLVEKNTPDTNSIQWLLDLNHYYFVNRPVHSGGTDSSLLFANRAEAISVQLNYPKGLGNSYMAISKALHKTHEDQRSKDYINKAIRIFTDNHLFTELGFAYWELAGYYSLSPAESQQKIFLIEKSVTSFHQAGNIKKEADALKELADVRQVNGNYIQALSELNRALKLYQSIHEPVLQGIYDLMGDVSCSVGNLNDAVRYGLLALETAEKLQDTSLQLCTIYNRLGVTYYYLKDYGSSALYYQKALNVAKKYKAYNDVYLITNNYGNILTMMNRPAEAVQLLHSTLNQYAGIDTSTLIQYTCSFVFNYSVLKQFSIAGKYFDQLTLMVQGRELNNEVQRHFYIAAVQYLLGSGQTQKARFYLEAEEKYLTENTNLIHWASNQLSWIKFDSATGNYKAAFHHFRKYISLKDSIYSQEKRRYIEQLNVQFETAKKDQDILLKEKNIELLQQETKMKQGELVQANQVKNWILSAILLLFVIIGLLINSARLKQQANKKLTDKQEEIGKKNKELLHLVDEKEWLIKEIHHRVKNNFHIVQGLLGTQSGYLKSEEAMNALADSRHRVQAMSLIHQKLYQSDSLSAINMADYIHELVNYLKDSFRNRQSIRFNVQVEPVELDLQHCIPLGLIMNEAITNAIKYAFPGGQNGMISILFKRSHQNYLTLLISDNGIGLPESFEVEKPVTMGMKLMKGLSEDIDAVFSVSGAEGTEIRLSFKFDPEFTGLHNANKKELSSTV